MCSGGWTAEEGEASDVDVDGALVVDSVGVRPRQIQDHCARLAAARLAGIFHAAASGAHSV